MKEKTQPPKKIAICYSCNDVPLIYTFAFNGAEYWCPGCGATHGMFDVEKTESTPDLEFELILHTAATKKYLDARGTLVCSARIIKGVRVDRKDFPPALINRCRKIIAEFELNRK